MDGDDTLPVAVDKGVSELITVSVRVAILLIVPKKIVDVLLVERVLGAVWDALVVIEIERIDVIDEEPDAVPTLLTLGEPV